ncbi:hypothetical protein CRENBAI_004951 [Crenichthys baileyi]|uniref:Inactive hydroxysteroid dehydrogenase-like protein 1 n=1 Tax=Crenichthys baileyi TaxID=28760 RepID=A0AAV9SLV0_9TELE
MAAVDSFQFLYREISRSCSSYFEALALVGAVYATRRAVVLLRACCTVVRVHFLPRMMPSGKLTQRYGDWAVIYGASEPVARAYAEELAQNGVSIIFITQDSSSLRDIVAFLTQTYGVETSVVTANFSLGQAAGMVERSRGAVVNISSGACCRPQHGRVTLAAFTGYLDNFSRALHFEYSDKGIFVQSLIPLQIASSRHQPSSPREGWFVPSPEVYASHAISTLGVSNRTTGYWPHTLQYGLIRCIPEWIWIFVSRVVLSAT